MIFERLAAILDFIHDNGTYVLYLFSRCLDVVCIRIVVYFILFVK